MDSHKIICGSLAGACVVGAIAMLARAHPAIAPPDLFFAGMFLFFVFVFLWSGWWDDAASRSAKPSRAERAVATGWFWMRRLVCWTGVFISFLIAASMLVDGIQPAQLPVVLFALFAGGMLIWAGLKGFGRARGMSDDASVHAERRKRYGWRL